MTELSALAESEGYAACDDAAQRRSPSAAGNPRSAECTSWERRSSGMTELSALAGSEGYAACNDVAQCRSPLSAYGTHEVQNALRGRGGAAE